MAMAIAMVMALSVAKAMSIAMNPGTPNSSMLRFTIIEA